MYKLIVFFNIITIFLINPSPVFSAQTPLITEKEILIQLKEDIKNIPEKASFAIIIDRWSNQYGAHAIEPLFTLTQDTSLDENIRYVTLMTMVKAGGAHVYPKLYYFLEDPSWSIKGGALRAIRMIHSAQPHENLSMKPTHLNAFRKLLNDKALVVRNEAVMTIAALKIQGLTPELLQALHDSKNYNKGKPVWVPQKILHLLSILPPSENTSAQLLPLLENFEDSSFIELTIQTLEKISPNKPIIKNTAHLEHKKAAWKNHLKKMKKAL